MRIEINVVSDDGTTITIGHNVRLDSGSKMSQWIWATKFDSDALRGLTAEQAWAASFLCMTAACQRLPIPTSHTASLAAASAWHEHRRREDNTTHLRALASEAEKSNRKPHGQRSKDRPDGELSMTDDGDVQHITT